jgi:hypothetical protein
MRGMQTATATSSETPGSYPMSSDQTNLPLYIRSFDGAYFYYLQHLNSDRLQLVLKYDWYDPNKKTGGKRIDTGNGFSAADIRYQTAGGGLVYYINAHLKATAYYEWIVNEQTALAGYEGDRKDNIFTCRLQFRF